MRWLHSWRNAYLPLSEALMLRLFVELALEDSYIQLKMHPEWNLIIRRYLISLTLQVSSIEVKWNRSYFQVTDCWWSRWTCGETGIWSSRPTGPASPCCSDAWSRTVSSPYVDLTLHWSVITNIIKKKSYYEGHSINKVTFPVRVLKLLGIDTIICERLYSSKPYYANLVQP